MHQRQKNKEYPLTEGQLKRLFVISKESGWSSEQVKEFMKEYYNVSSSKDLTLNQYNGLCNILELKMNFYKAMDLAKEYNLKIII